MTTNARDLVRISRAALILGITFSVAACNSDSNVRRAAGLIPSNLHSEAAKKFHRGGPTGVTINVDLRPYLAALIAAPLNPPVGKMLCEDIHPDHCLTSMKDDAGEARIIGSSGSGVDYIAIGKHDFESINGSSTKRIGVIRNFTGPASGNVLRCFSVGGTEPSCTFNPPDKSLGPPYLIPHLPVVGYEALKDASDPMYGPAPGSPLQPIAGAMLYTNVNGNGYLSFGINNFNNPSNNCNQTYAGGDHTKGLIVYVQSVPFGGNIGTQDAIVIDGYSGQSSINDHVERHLYVQGLGRVGFGVGWYNPKDGKYDQYNPTLGHTDYYEDHNMEVTLDDGDFNFQPALCEQGSAVPLWP